MVPGATFELTVVTWPYSRRSTNAGSTFLTPLLRRSGMARWIRNQRNGCVLADRLICAFDSARRRTGLMGSESLEQGQAMLIAPSSAVHTFFMRFPIDLAFVARDGRIVKACAEVAPWRLAMALGAYTVVELPAGTLGRCHTVAGDMLRLEP